MTARQSQLQIFILKTFSTVLLPSYFLSSVPFFPCHPLCDPSVLHVFHPSAHVFLWLFSYLSFPHECFSAFVRWFHRWMCSAVERTWDFSSIFLIEKRYIPTRDQTVVLQCVLWTGDGKVRSQILSRTQAEVPEHWFPTTQMSTSISFVFSLLVNLFMYKNWKVIRKGARPVLSG